MFLDTLEYSLPKRIRTDTPDLREYVPHMSHSPEYPRGQSLYETCGEVLCPPGSYWNAEGKKGKADRRGWEGEEGAMLIDQTTSIAWSPATEYDTTFLFNRIPSRHKGRAMSDYCSTLAVASSLSSSLSSDGGGFSDAADAGEALEMRAHFDSPVARRKLRQMEIFSREEALQPLCAGTEECMKVEDVCYSCRASIADENGSSFVNCNYCSKIFCGAASCVCSCEACSGVFCHTTCSTLNYKSAFERVMCLDCNNLC